MCQMALRQCRGQDPRHAPGDLRQQVLIPNDRSLGPEQAESDTVAEGVRTGRESAA